MHQVKNNQLLLSIDQMYYLRDSIAECFDQQFGKLIVNTHGLIINDLFRDLYYNSNSFSFFTAQNVLTLTEGVFENEVKRNFVLNLADRVALRLSVSNLDLDQVFESVATSLAVCRPSSTNAYNLTPAPISSSIAVDKHVLKDTIKTNFWLLVIYLTMQFYNFTAVHKLQSSSGNIKE